MRKTTNRAHALRRAIAILGSQQALADAVGISQPGVYQWIKAGMVPAHRVLAVETATLGLVTRYQLRPDLYAPIQPLPPGTLPPLPGDQDAPL